MCVDERTGNVAAYNAGGVYETLENHCSHRSPRVLIPPRKEAQLASASATTRERNRNIREQARLGKRSKVETAFYRYKIIIDPSMRTRGLASQRFEAKIVCKILNTMTNLGMPCSELTA